MDRLEHFMRSQQERGVTVLLSGVGADVALTMHNLRFHDWLPPGRVFPWEPDAPGSSTIKAVRHGYALLGEAARQACPHCGRIERPELDLYYMV
jgi:SulP family sulfate permease